MSEDFEDDWLSWDEHEELIKQAKQEKAKEIFDDIDKYTLLYKKQIDNNLKLPIRWIIRDLKELKKKHMNEGKNED